MSLGTNRSTQALPLTRVCFTLLIIKGNNIYLLELNNVYTSIQELFSYRGINKLLSVCIKKYLYINYDI